MEDVHSDSTRPSDFHISRQTSSASTSLSETSDIATLLQSYTKLLINKNSSARIPKLKMPPTLTSTLSPQLPKPLNVDVRTLTSNISPNLPRPLVLDTRTLTSTKSPGVPKPLNLDVRALSKRWGCSTSYSTSCTSHRTVILTIIIAVLILKILLIVLLVARHRKRKAARSAESARVREQILKQMEERNGGATGARVWERAPPPPYDSSMPRAPEVARTEGLGSK